MNENNLNQNNEDLDLQYEPTILSLTDEDGSEHEFELLDTLEEEDGTRYVALVPYFENPEESVEDSGELVILKVSEEETEDDEEDILMAIEDEEEFDRVSKIFVDRLSELYDFE